MVELSEIRREVARHVGNAGEIAARTAETLDEMRADRVAGVDHDNRNYGRAGLQLLLPDSRT